MSADAIDKDQTVLMVMHCSTVWTARVNYSNSSAGVINSVALTVLLTCVCDLRDMVLFVMALELLGSCLRLLQILEIDQNASV